MREAKNILELDELRMIDWMGFIFYPKSPRYVSEKPSYLPVNSKRIGVFVNAESQEVLRKVDEFQLDGIQLHGEETPDYCTILKTERPTIFLIKAFSINRSNLLHNKLNVLGDTPFSITKAYEGVCDYFLFDTATKGYGGSGKQFDWNILKRYQGTTPFLLSGGINPDSARACSLFHHEQCIGIDLNSGFEDAPAFKNVQRIQQFTLQLND